MKAVGSKIALAVLLVAVSGHGLAQIGGGGGMGGGRRARNPDAAAVERGNAPVADPAAAAGQLRDRLYDLRLQLMVTPEQAAAWARFSDAVWALAGRKGLHPAPPADDQTALQLVRLRAAQAQERAVRLKALGDAMEPLYAGFTPDQRRMADQDLAGAFP